MTVVTAWRKLANKPEAALTSSHEELLQQERTKLNSRMDDLSDAHISYVAEVIPSEASNYNGFVVTHQRIFVIWTEGWHI